MLGRVILFIGNKLFIAQDYTNVWIKRELENKTKLIYKDLTEQHIYKNLTCLGTRNTCAYMQEKVGS